MAKNGKKKSHHKNNCRSEFTDDIIGAFPSDVKTIEELRKKIMLVCSIYCSKNKDAPPNISKSDFENHCIKLVKAWEERYKSDKEDIIEDSDDPNAINIIDNHGYIIFNKKFINSTNSDYSVRIKIRVSFDGFFEADNSKKEVAFFSAKVYVHISNMLEKFKDVAKATKSNLSFQIFPYTAQHSYRVSSLYKKV